MMEAKFIQAMIAFSVVIIGTCLLALTAAVVYKMMKDK